MYNLHSTVQLCTWYNVTLAHTSSININTRKGWYTEK